MKINQNKLTKYLAVSAILLTTTWCTLSTMVQEKYTISKQDYSEQTVEGSDEASSKEVLIDNHQDLVNNIKGIVEGIIEDKKAYDEAEYKKTLIVYDNMTIEELSAKLERVLKSTLDGTGELFATYSLELGLDPYLTVAIVLLETGCSYECSQLVKVCNNVGGVKGGPGCWGGSYKSYPTLQEGITSYMDNLYNNYYSKGLTTPELINPKYASSKTWATKVNNYINKIKAS